MTPKEAAAIMIGTMARPSSPSVRLTALPAPTMTKQANGMKNQPRLISKSLKNGKVSDVAKRPLAVAHDDECRDAGDQEFDGQPRLAGKAEMRLLGDLQIVVIEADRAEAQRHQQHHPDIDAGDVGPQQRRDDDARQDHQPAHGRRAGLLEMRLRPVGADRLALALPDAQRVDDRRAEDEDDQRRGDQRAAGAEGDVAEDVEDRDLVREIDK